jgi:hypothetical protein
LHKHAKKGIFFVNLFILLLHFAFGSWQFRRNSMKTPSTIRVRLPVLQLCCIAFMVPATAHAVSIDRILSGNINFAHSADAPLTGSFARAELSGTINVLAGSVVWGGNASFEAQAERFDGEVDQDNDGFDLNDSGLNTVTAYLSGAAGDLVIGRTSGALSQLTFSAPNVAGGVYGVNFPHLIHTETIGFASYSPTSSPNYFERSTKIAFYTPDRLGLRLGVSYAPRDNEPERVQEHRLDKQTEFALMYRDRIGALPFNATVGYYKAKTVPGATQFPQGFADPRAISIGSSLSYRGFQFGFSALEYQNFFGFNGLKFRSHIAGLSWRKDRWTFGYSSGVATTKIPRGGHINAGQGDRETRLSELAAKLSLCPQAFFCVADVETTFGIGLVNLQREDFSRVNGAANVTQDESYLNAQLSIGF